MTNVFVRRITEMPGGIPYRDPRVSEKHFPGMQVASVEEQARIVIRWRLQNPKVYPPEDGKWLNMDYVIEEIINYQRQRLGNDKKYFKDGTVLNGVLVPKVVEPSMACSCGSTEADPVYCPTCRGKRIIGFKCRSCGKKRPR
jgi:hypothetical protein